jgi:type IV secretory pathway TraG/TraD family ATPase VirD4
VEEWFSLIPNKHNPESDAFVLGRPYLEDRAVVGNSFLAHNAQVHMTIFGPTRSAKGAGALIYNILRTQPGQSQFVVDPKGEIVSITGDALRKQGKEVVLIDPFNLVAKREGFSRMPYQVGFNPIFEIDPFSNDAPQKIAELAEILIEKPKGGASGGSEYWHGMTVIAVSGLLAYALAKRSIHFDRINTQMRTEGRAEYTADELRKLYATRNLLAAAYFPTLSSDQVSARVACMENFKQDIKHEAAKRGARPLFPTVTKMICDGGAACRQLVGKNADKEAVRSLFTMIQKNFRWMDTPSMINDLTGLDFAFSMSHFKSKENMAVFVVVPDTALQSHAGFLRMVVTSAINAVMGNDWPDGVNPKRHKINMYFDEVAHYGNIPAMLRLYGLGAGYGARAFMIAQDVPQLIETYGKNVTDSIIENSCSLLMGAGGPATAGYFSRFFGQTWARQKESGEETDEKVDVLSAAEIMRLLHPSRENFLYVEPGRGPVIGKKMFYHRELKSGVDFRQHFTFVGEDDQILSRGADPDLVAVPRGFGRDSFADSDSDEPEQLAFEEPVEMLAGE